MKHKRLAVILWTFVASALAQGAEQAASEDWAALRTRGVELHEKSKQMRAEAERKYGETETACRDKLLTAICIADAGKARQAAEREAKRVEREARDIERKVKAHEREEKEAKRRVDAPRREAEAAKRAEKNRREQEEAMKRVEKKQADEALRGRK